MKAKIAAAALGLGMVVGSLMGGTHVGAAPLGGTGAASASYQACPCEQRVTTSRLNLRSGPGTDYDVLLVMEEGAEVQMWTNAEQQQNGFAKVKYGETYGWASMDFLADPGTDTGGFGGGEEWIVGTGVTSSRVNFRSGPGFDYEVRDVLEQGEGIAYSDVVVNGFRYVWHAGVDGWVSDDFIAEEGALPAGDGDSLTTTTNLNLRESPDLDSDVILVMPENSEVIVVAYDGNSDFTKVNYNGTVGYAWATYLQ
jgi:uncharacterized protein YgiM (DUF1202 family)